MAASRNRTDPDVFRNRAHDWTGGGAPHQYWLSYADLLAGLLMVFALLLLTAFHTYQDRAAPVQDLVETRRAIADTLQARFEGRDFLQVDNVTGAVRFGGEVLFDRGSSDLRQLGRERLREFAADYLPVLLGIPRFREHLEEIVIEGHTDQDGPFPPVQVEENYLFNLGLSQDRASSVMRFLLEQATEYEDALREYVTANGRSFSDLLFLDADPTTVDKQGSRRIEIRFRLNDEQVIQEILERLFFRSPDQ